jgi:hypothetical protein
MKNYHHIYGKSALDQRNIIDEEFRHLVFFIYPSEVMEEIILIVKSHSELDFDDIDKYVKYESEYVDMPFIPFDFDPNHKTVNGHVDIQEKEQTEEVSKDEDWFEDDCLPGTGFLEENEVVKEETLPIIDPPRDIMKLVGEAIKDFNMIQENDGILVAVSGGKDSLSLLHVLRYLQKKAPVKFRLGAVTIDPTTVEYDPSPLKDYLKKLGIPYFYEVDNLIERAETSMQNNSL